MGAFESRVDSSETIYLLKGFVGIKSVNPSLVHGAPVEVEIAEHVREFMRGIGIYTWVEEVESGLSNAFGALKGTGNSLR